MKPGAVFFWTHHNRLNMTIQSQIYFRMKSGESVRLFDANRCLSNIVSCDYRTDDEELNQKIYKIANDAVYMFSASEMDVRLKQTLNVVRRMSADELSVPQEIDSMKDGFIARIIVDTDEINGVSYMQKIVDNVNNVFDKSIMLGYAIVGLYLKKADCYENFILTEEFLSDCFKTISMNIQPTNEMIDVVFDVGDMLEKILWKYEKRLYDAIFTELCERGIL